MYHVHNEASSDLSLSYEFTVSVVTALPQMAQYNPWNEKNHATKLFLQWNLWKKLELAIDIKVQMVAEMLHSKGTLWNMDKQSGIKMPWRLCSKLY